MRIPNPNRLRNSRVKNSQRQPASPVDMNKYGGYVIPRQHEKALMAFIANSGSVGQVAQEYIDDLVSQKYGDEPIIVERKDVGQVAQG